MMIFSPYLEEIKENIHNEKIEKEAMNSALIAIEFVMKT